MSLCRYRSIMLAASAAAIFGCREGSELPTGSGTPELRYAKGRTTAGPVVSSASPAYGQRGETGKPVTITGSGFSQGATVTWERNGVPDPGIIVHSAVVVSSSRIDATISIASDAELSFYDIAVTSLDRKKGIGTETFEVTTAQSIGTFGGNTEVSATTDLSEGVQAVGWTYDGGIRHAFYWPDANGRMASLGSGVANAVSADGRMIGGIADGYAVTWTLAGSSWLRSRLPVSAGAAGSRVNAMAAAADGTPLIIAGSEQFKGKGSAIYNHPRLWRWSGSSWALDSLPMPATDNNVAVAWVNPAGQSVGGLGLYWDELGNLTTLPGPVAGSRAINNEGTIVVGFVPPVTGSETVAAYWTRTRDALGVYGTWAGPFVLPGTCSRAIGIDSHNRILAHRCAASSTRYVSAVFLPPYDAASMITLHGTGIRTDGGSAWAISPNGTLIGGRAVSGGSDVGIIWRSVLP